MGSNSSSQRPPHSTGGSYPRQDNAPASSQVPPQPPQQRQQQQQQQQQQQHDQQPQWQKQTNAQLIAWQEGQQQQQQQENQKKSQQQQKQPPPEPEEKSDIKVKKVKLDKNVLERYLELEKETRHLESKNVLKNYRMKQDQLTDFEETIKVYDARYKDCVKQTEKEKADVDGLIKDMFSSDEEYTTQHSKEQVTIAMANNSAKEKADVDHMANPSVKGFFSQQSEYDAKFMKEKEEYLEALNKQEIAKKELDQAKKMRDQVKQDTSSLKKEADKVQKIYTEQDELLAGIFNGKYGSETEYKLESELDMMLDRKQRISVARYKWQNGRLLIQHAVNQLAFAIKKWGEVIRIPPTDMKARYVLATETRNNIVAANQNITSAHKYLNTIEFPYCKPAEMETLNKATNNIYTDMQSEERHGHATQCYGTTHKRAAALLQWFDHVIKTTIEKDFDLANKAVDSKTKELRQERLKLIKQKIHEEKGDDLDLDIQGEMDLGDDEPEQELENLFTDADAVSNAGETADKSNSPDPTGPTPLPTKDLAPPPNNDELFGDISALKQQHESQMEEFSRAQDVNKARMNQGLEEKLKARRSRRARQDSQE